MLIFHLNSWAFKLSWALIIHKLSWAKDYEKDDDDDDDDGKKGAIPGYDIPIIIILISVVSIISAIRIKKQRIK